MPAQRDTPHREDKGRRRVRTGCLTCRRRRRKCDEAKPECQNCRDKSLTCHYGVKLVFLDSTPQCFSGKRRHASPPEAVDPTPSGSDVHDQPTRVDDAQPPATYVPETSQPTDSTPPSEHAVHDAQQDSKAFIAPSYTPAPIAAQEQPRQELDDPLPLDILCGAAQAAHYVPTPPTHHDNPLLASLHLPAHQELSHLSHYRHHIAPLLDLDLSRDYFGVQVLLRSSECSELRHALVALAASHAVPQDPQVLLFVRQAQSVVAAMESPSDRLTAELLLAWSNIYTSAPTSWPKVIGAISGLTHITPTVDQWLLLARLTLSCQLLASSSTESLPALPPPSFHISQGSIHTEHQFLHSMVLLQRSLEFAARQRHPRTSGNFPAASAWQMCWSEAQIWFATRNLAMEEVLAVSESDVNHGSVQFPVIVFSSACAFVANIVHHLTCLVLLQHRFRTVHVAAEAQSSTSPIWHARRIVGICASTDEHNRWDPLVVAALVCASQRLSHEKQLGVVVDILRKAAQEGGLKLDTEVQKVASLATLA